MNSKSKLDNIDALNCPFCGNQPVAELVQGAGGDGFELGAVRCVTTSCHVKPRVGSTMVEGEGLIRAIERWNVRPKVRL